MQKHLENQIRTNQVRTERSKQLICLAQTHMTHPNKSTNFHSSLHSGHPAVAAALSECPLPRMWDAGEVTPSRKPVSRKFCFAICLSRWLHRQARLVAHLFCVLILFSHLQATLTDAVSCAPSSEQKSEVLRGNQSGAVSRLQFVSVVGFINKPVSLRIFSVC